MPKPTFHKDVNYEVLSVTEKKIKASRELFTIFYLDGNKGLTDMEVFEKAKELDFTGYDGLTPDCIVRSHIYRWNDMAIFAVTRGKTCEESGCKKICSWGFEENQPSFCERHKLEGMTRVVEERLVKMPRETGQSKGKYYFDPKFAQKVWGGSLECTPTLETAKMADTRTSSESDDLDFTDGHTSSRIVFSEAQLKGFEECIDFPFYEHTNLTTYTDPCFSEMPMDCNAVHNSMSFDPSAEYIRFKDMKYEDLMSMDLDLWLNGSTEHAIAV